MQYQSIPRGTDGSIIGCTTAPNAQHVLLRSPNLPTCNIVFDGDKYWFYIVGAGWHTRKAYNGHIPTLHLCPAYSACTAGLPFKVRHIPNSCDYPNWESYLKTLAK